MKNNKTDLKLSGIIPPMVTPLLSSNKLDVKGLEKLINHLINGGIHGLFILGTTGEISRLSASLKEELIKRTCLIVNQRVPVLVGVTDTSIHETLRLQKIAVDAGASAIVQAPPFYYHVEQSELLNYFIEVAEKSDLPLFLYNMPSRTNITIEINTVIEASRSDHILGIKDSSGDQRYIQSLINAFREFPDFTIFIGPEEIMAQAVLMGAHGGVNGGANLFPELYVELYKAARYKDMERVNNLQNIVLKISNTLYRVGSAQPNYAKIIKEALSQLGICQPVMEKPYIPFTEKERSEIDKCLQLIKPLVTPESLRSHEIS